MKPSTRLPAILAALLTCAAATPLLANLGDTETQVHEHYGKLVAPPQAMTNMDVIYYFHYKDFVVTVTLINAQSQRETFLKPDYKPISEKELQEILEANSLGSKWKVMQDNKNVKIWLLENHAAIAGYDKGHPFLSIRTQSMVEFDDAVKALHEKQAQEQAQHPQAQPIAPKPVQTATPADPAAPLP